MPFVKGKKGLIQPFRRNAAGRRRGAHDVFESDKILVSNIAQAGSLG